MFGNYLLYPLFAGIVGISFLLIVPKEHYKRYLLWGLVFGGIGDALTVSLLTQLNLIQYKNMGPFNIFNLFSIWTPITWALTFSIFFYLMPVRKVFLVPYIITFTALNYSVGLVMQSMGCLNILEFTGI